MFVMHRKNFGDERQEEAVDFHEMTLSSAEIISASAITGVLSSEYTTTDSSNSSDKIASSGLVPLRMAARVFHIASIVKSQKAKSEGVIDSKFAQLIAGGDLTGSIA